MANQIGGVDYVPSFPSITITIAARNDWSFIISGPIPGDRLSLVSVVLHEIAHGLGISTLWASGTSTESSIFDTKVVDSTGTPLSAYKAGFALSRAVTSGIWHWDGPAGMAAGRAYDGHPPMLYTPGRFSASSLTHFDPAVYSGGPENLMTPDMGFGQTRYSTGRIIAMLTDLGWSFASDHVDIAAPTTVAPTTTTVTPITTPKLTVIAPPSLPDTTTPGVVPIRRCR